MSHILITDPQHPSYDWLKLKWRNDKSIDVVLTLDECTGGEWLFLVSCSKFVPKSVRSLYKHTLVLHASDLPKGRGWSPWVHAIREGAECITLSVIEAVGAIDGGPVWLKQVVSIAKTDLYEDIAFKLAKLQAETIEWIVAHPEIEDRARPQDGEPTHCRKLTEYDSEVWFSPHEAWDTLRTCDPNRFPAWFEVHGQRYNIRIERAEA